MGKRERWTTAARPIDPRGDGELALAGSIEHRLKVRHALLKGN